MSIISSPFPNSIHGMFFNQRLSHLTRLTGILSNIDIQDEKTKLIQTNILQQAFYLNNDIIWDKNYKESNMRVDQNLACLRATEQVENLICKTEELLKQLQVDLY